MSLKTGRFHLTTGIILSAFIGLTGCDDFKGVQSLNDLGNRIDPVPGSQKQAERDGRPKPDANGVISYPNYKVIVAKRGDTIGSLASRVGISADNLAKYNGLSADHRPRAGEVLALPKTAVSKPKPVALKVEEPAKASTVEDIASEALEDVPNTPAVIPKVNSGPEPLRHTVEPGETAYTIARQYAVSVTALASWNGLDREFSVREGQQLLIPVTQEKTEKVAVAAPPATVAETPKPGSGSAAPLPPSAPKPLPKPPAKVETPEPPKLAETKPAVTPKPVEPKPTVTATPKPTTPKPAETKTADAGDNRRLLKPVVGKVLRPFSSKPGGNEGIDFGAAKGTPVKAAENGTVALTSSSAGGTTIILIRHPENLYTVYSNVGAPKVKKGQRVKRGETIGEVAGGNPPYVHFEVRRGTEPEDPAPYL